MRKIWTLSVSLLALAALLGACGDVDGLRAEETMRTQAAWPTVQRGDLGRDVVTVQYLLRHHGQSLSVDGSFGPATENAVKSFQAAKGLSADGIVGSNT